jgi:hypothetical protein
VNRVPAVAETLAAALSRAVASVGAGDRERGGPRQEDTDAVQDSTALGGQSLPCSGGDPPGVGIVAAAAAAQVVDWSSGCIHCLGIQNPRMNKKGRIRHESCFNSASFHGRFKRLLTIFRHLKQQYML